MNANGFTAAFTIGFARIACAGLSCAPALELAGESAQDGFAPTVGVLDINGDGLLDLVVGASAHDSGGPNAGRVYAFSGNNGKLLYTLDGLADHERFGGRLAALTDVDDDGHGDYLVRAGGWQRYAGRVGLHSGADGRLIRSFYGANRMDFLGSAIASAGDLNDDDADDLIIGAEGWNDGAGHVWVYSGRDGTTLFEFSGKTDEHLGSSAASLGDITNDGIPDFIIGARHYDADGAGSGDKFGRAYVYSGDTGDELFLFTGEHSQHELGFHVAGLGDLTGDGTPDFVISSVEPQFRSGADGSEIPFTTQSLRWARPIALPDFDGDGVDDVLSSRALDYDETPPLGRALVMSGATGRVLSVYTDLSATFFAGLADVNGDGLGDVALGSLDALARHGRVSVYHGTAVRSPDVNGDDTVDLTDLLWMLSEWGPCLDALCQSDLNMDESVDGCDLETLLVNWTP